MITVISSQIHNPPIQGAVPTSVLSTDSSISAHLHTRELRVHPLYIFSEEWQDDDDEHDEHMGMVRTQQQNLQCCDDLRDTLACCSVEFCQSFPAAYFKNIAMCSCSLAAAMPLILRARSAAVRHLKYEQTKPLLLVLRSWSCTAPPLGMAPSALSSSKSKQNQHDFVTVFWHQSKPGLVAVPSSCERTDSGHACNAYHNCGAKSK